MKVDFHIHSNFSDGNFTPKELINIYSKNNFKIIALTDHDTVLGCDEAIKYGAEAGIKVIPGIELSTKYKGEDVHILGYFKGKNYKNKYIEEYMETKKEKRKKKCKEMCERLLKYFNIKVDYEKIISENPNMIGRSTIVKYIIEAGYEQDFETCFAKYMKENSPVYVPASIFLPNQGIDMLKKSGAIAVLAHPALQKKSTIEELLQIFNFDGVEAIYSLHTKEETDKYINIANKNGLLITAGSDFHRYYDISHGISENVKNIYLNNTNINKIFSMIS